MNERREKPRFKVPQFIDISFMKEDFIDVEGIDISLKGLKIKSSRALEPYTKVFCMIALEGEAEPVNIEGLVVHVDEAQGEVFMGIQFVDMTSSITKKLEAYLARLS